jgi:NAD(P)-dependent dehydrogenase (short-subunit alcohol dehydrogenase family)
LNFRVYAGVRNPADGDRLRSQASARLTAIRLDVTDTKTIAEVSQRIGDEVGSNGLAGLVNNAGIGIVGPL